jgi:hypothetical protein
MKLNYRKGVSDKCRQGFGAHLFLAGAAVIKQASVLPPANAEKDNN